MLRTSAEGQIASDAETFKQTNKTNHQSEEIYEGSSVQQTYSNLPERRGCGQMKAEIIFKIQRPKRGQGLFKMKNQAHVLLK